MAYENKRGGMQNYSDNGDANVITKGGTTDYGPYPASYYADFAGAATAQTAATLLTLTNLTNYDGVSFSVHVLTGTAPAVKIYPSFDGVNFEITPLAIVDLASTALGTAIAGSAGATMIGNYTIPNASKFRSLRFDYTASAAGNASIRGGYWKR